ncbi:MAG: beta-N-acetylhexosaminidase [Actinobacteria bacterium HGW-Actinobacteria-4]|nr:MAG: beta-N-acetylhexosaminidase [Actinobacteria bacterium HGW-Actinobacteria-4]
MSKRWIAASGVAVVAMAAGAVFGAFVMDRDPADPTPGVTVAASASPVASASPSPSPSPTRDEQFLVWGPSLADWDAALATAQSLPLERAAGQVIVASYNSTGTAGARTLVADHHLGGLIIMGDAVTTESALLALTAAAREGGGVRDWPVIVSVDHEGGTVARLSGPLPGMPAFMSAGSARDKTLVRNAYAAMGADMAELGFNLNYAPVADVTIGLADPTIRSRSAGSDPGRVAETVIAAMGGFIEGGVVPAIKHFPGHGSVTTDSHVALPIQGASVAQLAVSDLVPFERAINAGAPVVMMSHVAVTEWGGTPSTVDPDAYAYLRNELGFTGVIVTDAMNMRAVTDGRAPGAVAVEALVAGADIVLMPADVGAAHAAIVAAVNSGQLSRATLDQAAARGILLMRWQAGLTVSADAKALDGTYARVLAGNGATVVTDLCGTPLVGSTVSIRGGFPGERAALADALAVHGISNTGGGTSIVILGSSVKGANADVVVSMDGPWALADSRAETYVALYGRSHDALAGLADVLAGAVTPQAVWPVPIAGMPYGPCPSPR